jgi:hypothetical protein
MTGVGTFNQGLKGEPAVDFAELGTAGGKIRLRHVSDLPPALVRTGQQKSPEIVK